MWGHPTPRQGLPPLHPASWGQRVGTSHTHQRGCRPCTPLRKNMHIGQLVWGGVCGDTPHPRTGEPPPPPPRKKKKKQQKIFFKK
jgi:hypothetical protein